MRHAEIDEAVEGVGSLGKLAKLLSKELGRPISRQQMNGYCTHENGPPNDVREACARLSLLKLSPTEQIARRYINGHMGAGADKKFRWALSRLHAHFTDQVEDALRRMLEDAFTVGYLIGKGYMDEGGRAIKKGN